jgi:ribonucleoside-diphosphate reductase alpha chain
MAQFPSKEIAKNSYEYRPLGLGFAGLGSLLMKMGLPYDSDDGRIIASGLSSLLTSEAYAQSAKIAKDIDKPFNQYKNNESAMLHVIEMHKEKSNDLGVSIQKRKMGYNIKVNAFMGSLGTMACNSWRNAHSYGVAYGFRNAQVTCIAPTGTIGLLMDCNTTGIEPDFALVKHKRLAGGGRFRIVNSAIRESLKTLKYAESEIEEIGTYVITHMTIEGAPHLKTKHLPIFDTATPQGKSRRVIDWMAHIKMMQAVQPFISGAISKTINMPNNCSFEDISEAYKESWKLGLKSITVYRDQSKLSQPLSSFGNDTDIISRAISRSKPVEAEPEPSPEEETAYTADMLKRLYESVNKAGEKHHEKLYGVKEIEKPKKAEREPLPPRRKGYIQKSKIAGHSLFLHTGEYEDGKLGEIFIDMHREGAAFRSLLNSFAIAVSLGLQYGVPLEEYVDAFVFSKFEPNGMVQGHKYIKMVTSVIDYIFRDLAITYLDRYDLGQVKPEDLAPTAPAEVLKLIQEEKEENNEETGYVKPDYPNGPRLSFDRIIAPVDNKKSKKTGKYSAILEARIKGYEGDPCPTCGAFTLIRNGTCMKCDTCGNTTGCS